MQSNNTAMAAERVNPPVGKILVKGYDEPFLSLCEIKNFVVARIRHVQMLHMSHGQSKAQSFEPQTDTLRDVLVKKPFIAG